MKWLIPAKTFLIGEYVALSKGPAILINTSPFFTLRQNDNPGLEGIHPQSPAGKYWQDHGRVSIGLSWEDPYTGKGGLGASSAQFIGVFTASHEIKNQTFSQDELLNAYFKYAWNGEGIKPSGYDVLAQAQHSSCVFIEKGKVEKLHWPFEDIGFLLLHTGKKLPTHIHLHMLNFSGAEKELETIVHEAKEAFTKLDSQSLTDSINNYHYQLKSLGLVAPHTQKIIEEINEPEIMAMKGCGAMGADIVLVLVKRNTLEPLTKSLQKKGYNVITTSANLL